MTQARKYIRTNSNTRIRSENEENKSLCSLTKLSQSDTCSLSSLPQPNVGIGLARKHNEEYGPTIPLVEGVILGRMNRKRSLAGGNRVCIDIDVTANGISRNQVQILKIKNDSMEINVFQTAKNPILLQRGDIESLLQVGDSDTVNVGDYLIFDVYETHPVYIYKVVPIKTKPRVIKRAKPLQLKPVNQSSLELINNIKQPLYSPTLFQWTEHAKKEALISYLITKSLKIPCKQSILFFRQRNPTFDKVRNDNNVNLQARNYLKLLNKKELDVIQEEVARYTRSLKNEDDVVDNHVDPPPKQRQKSKNSTIVKQCAPRIKAGVRFRVMRTEEDLFGKRKQWCYGTARSVLKVRDDVFKSTNDFKHEIDLVFRDSSVGKFSFPDSDVQVLFDDDGVFARTDEGVQLAYDKNPGNICLGDLVDCRMGVKDSFFRGRVVEINEDDKSCRVILTNHKVRSQQNFFHTHNLFN